MTQAERNDIDNRRRQAVAEEAAGKITPEQFAKHEQWLTGLEQRLVVAERGLRSLPHRLRKLERQRQMAVRALADRQQQMEELEQLRTYEKGSWSWKTWRGAFNQLAVATIAWAVFRSLFRR